MFGWTDLDWVGLGRHFGFLGELALSPGRAASRWGFRRRDVMRWNQKAARVRRRRPSEGQGQCFGGVSFNREFRFLVFTRGIMGYPLRHPTS